MPRSTPLPLKLCPPRLLAVNCRVRIAEEVKRALAHPALWVSGPPGAGKTTAIACYLRAAKRPVLWYRLDAAEDDPGTLFQYLHVAASALCLRKGQALPVYAPMHAANLAGYARRFFAVLFERLPPRALVVFDNLNAVQASYIESVLGIALEANRDDTNLIFISRLPSPPLLAKARVEQVLGELTWETLRYTEAEVEKLIEDARLTGATAEEWMRLSDGWAVGLTLMAQAARRDAPMARIDPSFDLAHVFDYLATQFFDVLPAASAQLLHTTCFLPEFSAGTAIELSGNPAASALIDELRKANLFVLRNAAGRFEYHPLLREFLQQRAPLALAPQALCDVLHGSARYLLEAGEQEAALTLLLRAGEPDRGLEILLSLAPRMLAQGRLTTLRTHLEALQGALANQAWPLFWHGVCLSYIEPQAGLRDLHAAQAKFEQMDDTVGQIMCASAVFETHFMARLDFCSIDPWLERLERLLRELGVPEQGAFVRPYANLVCGLLYRQGSNPRLKEYVHVALSALRGLDEPETQVYAGFHLANYACAIGDVGLSAQVLTQTEPYLRKASAATQSGWLVARHFHERIVGCREKAWQAIQAMTLLARREQFPVIDFAEQLYGAIHHLSFRERDESRTAVARFQGGLDARAPWDSALANMLQAWLLTDEGDFVQVIAVSRASFEALEKLGVKSPQAIPRLHHALALAETGDTSAALEALSYKCGLWKSAYGSLQAGLIVARAQALRGQVAASREALALALQAGRNAGLHNPELIPDAILSELMTLALEHALEVAYVHEVIRTRRLAPLSPDVECWPWPVRVQTLGRFEVMVAGEPLRFARKAQEKPLALLKACIALGSRGVSAERVAELLWPEADGDAAQSALTTTLHRLRKLLKRDDAIELSAGQLSLDFGVIWVDTVAVEALLDCLGSVEGEPDAGKVECLFRIYRGAFLGQDAAPGWALPLRERLTSKFRRCVRDLVRAATPAAGEQIILRALEVDPAAHVLYQDLIDHYQAEGRTEDALDMQQRLQRQHENHADPSM